MSYTNPGKADFGNLAKIGPNTKGTGRVGVPVAVALMGRDKALPAVEDLQGTKGGSASGQTGIKNVGSKRTLTPDPAPRVARKIAAKS